MLEIGQTDFFEDRVVLSNVLSQIKSVTEIHYQYAEGNIESELIQLRKLILILLMECSTEPEVDDQQQFFIM